MERVVDLRPIHCAVSCQVCYALGRQAFNELLGPIEDVWRFESLRTAPILVNLSEQQLFQLARCMARVEFAAGEVVSSLGAGHGEGGHGWGGGHLQPHLGPAAAHCAERWPTPRQRFCSHHLVAGYLSQHDCHLPQYDYHWPQYGSPTCPAAVRPDTCYPQVFQKNDPGDTFYVVEDGTFRITDGQGGELAQCSKGQCFGELALLKSEPRAATVTALIDAKVGHGLGRGGQIQLREVLGRYRPVNIAQNERTPTFLSTCAAL